MMSSQKSGGREEARGIDPSAIFIVKSIGRKCTREQRHLEALLNALLRAAQFEIEINRMQVERRLEDIGESIELIARELAPKKRGVRGKQRAA